MQIYDSAVKAEDFAVYLRVLSRKLKKRPFALFMDQLNVHKAKIVKPLYTELGITPIFNKAGSPDFNPIESTFAQVKREYCRQRLRSLANDLYFDMAENMKKSFEKVTKDMCQNCILRSERKLQAT